MYCPPPSDAILRHAPSADVVGPALDRVQLDPLAGGRPRRALVVVAVVVVGVRRRIADQVDDLHHRLLLAPGHLVHRLVERARHVFRPVAAAVGVEAAQPAIDAIQVVIEVEHLGHVGVADVAVRDQADPQVGRRLSLRDEARQAPDLSLRALDQAGHRAGRVEREHQLDARPRGGDGRLAPAGRAARARAAPARPRRGAGARPRGSGAGRRARRAA